MKKELLVHETKKLWSVPMFAIFTVLCLIINNLLCLPGESSKYISYIGSVYEDTGGVMGDDFTEKLCGLPDNEYKDRLIVNTAGAEDIFEDFDASEIGNHYIGLYNIGGTAADIIDSKYKKLQYSVNALAKTDASLSVYAAEETESLHERLFRTVIRAAVAEGIIIAALMALYLSGCERQKGTACSIYSTKTGRKIQWIKAITGGIWAVSVYTLLIAAAVLAFSALNSMGGIWSSSVSSQFNKIYSVGYSIPFITWRPFTLLKYTLASASLGAVTVIIAYIIAFSAGILCSDTYKGFLFLFSATVLNFGIFIFSGDSKLWLIYQLMHWTYIPLWWFEPLWFTDMGAGAMVPWQECCSAAACLITGAFLLKTSLRRFGRKDVI